MDLDDNQLNRLTAGNVTNTNNNNKIFSEQNGHHTNNKDDDQNHQNRDQDQNQEEKSVSLKHILIKMLDPLIFTLFLQVNINIMSNTLKYLNYCINIKNNELLIL